MRFKIHNGGFCTSKPASLHLYWTMASTGEAWPNDWIDHYTGTDTLNHPGCHCLIGDEITTLSDGSPYPYPIASIPPYGTVEYWQYWSPPNFTDPNALNYVNPAACVDNAGVRHLNVEGDDVNGKFEICLLARLQSLDNPIFGVETDNTTQNVLNSNNIVTRNTFLIDATTISGLAIDGNGGDNGGIITHFGTPSIILVANNNDYIKNLDITLDKISGGSTEALDQLMQIDLIPGDELWQKWQSTGFKGEGIQIIADKVIRVTNMETAKLLDIPFNAKEFEPLKIKVTILSYSGKVAPTNQVPNNYTFKVSHRSSNPAVSINKPTACIFNVADLQKYAQAPATETTILPNNATLNCYPNPFKNQLSFVVQTFAATNISLALYDLQGKLVSNLIQNQNIEANQHTFTLNASDLPKGMYIARLIAGNTTVVKKVVKW